MLKKWWQREVIYQIYPKSFNDSNHDGIGDIKGITQKLDYLKTLGITMVWICPVFKSPMADNGYDISDFYQLNPEFGDMEDLDELILEAKEKGIKIVLDLVINHTSDEHPWFQDLLENPKSSKYRDYYILKQGKEGQPPTNWRSVFGGSVWEPLEGTDEYYFHSFHVKQPDLNWENEHVRKELYEVVNYWLEKGIAGFRVDAITFIKKDQRFENLPADGVDGLGKCTKKTRNQPGIEKFLHELNRETFSKYNCVTIGEAPGVPYDQYGDYIGEDGYFSMIFDFKYADLDVASGSEWFRRTDWNVQELKRMIFKSQLEIQKVGWGANFLENHDQNRSLSKYIKEADNRNFYSATMLAALFINLRGTPFIYQGQEIGMTNFERESIEEFDDISSIDQYYRAMEEGFSAEEALHFMNLRSRDNSRTPFHWNSEENGGFSKKRPWLGMNENYTLINVEKQENDPNSILNFYKEIIKVRQSNEPLIYGEIEPLLENNSTVIAYKRRLQGEEIDCYFNFSSENQKVDIDLSCYDVLLNNYKGAAIPAQDFKLYPYQSLLLSKKGMVLS
ncbi:alpha-glucosidase [Rossellomorea aquimaris]|jgi:alpha-glucosidase|uniref:Alpha-amylase n=1 Tax=Rossellomorea aquimaris TaxID=189382 RepID=A0A5D4ULM4_9BACI|nr:alpha-glucosidase [Rossellomorea aquimaris]TYS81831.1 alpha-glucosidase [Rossellomorea aquimaris]TYS88455.1 alpha-glucosidase [Rossellomorea aquimaris]